MKDEKAPEYLTLEIKDPEGRTWGIIHAMAKTFNTGSVGFYAAGKVVNGDNPTARYQLGANITLIGSKQKD